MDFSFAPATAIIQFFGPLFRINMPIHYPLLPFNHCRSVDGFRASIGIQKDKINLEYILSGDMTSVLLPIPSDTPGRKRDLSQHSCFECFIGVQGEPAYYEINLSPSGDWNTFHFTDFREGMEEAADLVLEELRSETSNENERTLRAKLSGLSHRADASLDINLASVIEDKEGHLSYFALEHQPERANFHTRKLFKLKYAP